MGSWLTGNTIKKHGHLYKEYIVLITFIYHLTIGNELSAKMFILIAVGVFRYLKVASVYGNIKALPRRFRYN